MKFVLKSIAAVFFIAVIIFVSLYVFVLFKGRPLLVKQLEGLTKRKVSVDHIGITPPLNIEIKKLNIEGLLKVNHLSLSPSIIGFLTGNIALNNVNIVDPELTYEKTQPQETQPPAIAGAGSVEPKMKILPRLVFKHLKIKNGMVDFLDSTADKQGEGLRIIIRDVDFNLDNLYVLPRSIVTNFNLKGKIPWQEGTEAGTLEFEGWIDLFKKDMQADLKIIDIDGIYLYPYYSNWVDLKKARIEKAKLNFTSSISGLNNNITAECHLELTDILRKPLAPEESSAKAAKITDVVLDMFRALNQGKIALDFTIRTKMDKPEFGFGNIRMAFEDKLEQGRRANGFQAEEILKLPGTLIQGTLKGASDLTKAVFDGMVSVGREAKRVVEDVLSKESDGN